MLKYGVTLALCTVAAMACWPIQLDALGRFDLCICVITLLLFGILSAYHFDIIRTSSPAWLSFRW